MKEITAFGCEFCSMVSRRKGSVVRHESHHCRKNPSRQACGNCQHTSYDEGDTHIHMFDINGGYQPPTWYCLELEKNLESQYLNINIDCASWKLKGNGAE